MIGFFDENINQKSFMRLASFIVIIVGLAILITGKVESIVRHEDMKDSQVGVELVTLGLIGKAVQKKMEVSNASKSE